MHKLIVIHLLAWLPLVVIAIINGSIREFSYGRVMDELQAHQLSTLTGVIFSAIYVYFLHRLWPLASAQQAVVIGIAWLLMTIAFEFSFGHFVMGHAWQHLLADYNLLAGRVWLIFLLWVMLSPYVIHRFTG